MFFCTSYKSGLSHSQVLTSLVECVAEKKLILEPGALLMYFAVVAGLWHLKREQ